MRKNTYFEFEALSGLVKVAKSENSLSGDLAVPGLAEIAAAIMIGAERRIEVTAANVSNVSTPGYHSRRIFSETLNARSGIPVFQEALARPQGNLAIKETGASLDFATDSSSLLALRSPSGLTYSRSAQLQRDSEGRLIDSLGRALQSNDGADLIVTSGAPTVLGDGTLLVDGQPQGRIGLYNQASIEAGRPTMTDDGSIRQGMVVGSDVELGDEMAELNRASRMAETGARLFQLGDDLLGKAASMLGSIPR